MKFSQTERGVNNFSAVSRGDQKFNRVFHPVPTTPLRELKNDNSLTYKFKTKCWSCYRASVNSFRHARQ